MNRNLKVLGVSFLTILALCGVVASAASAKFDSESSHSILGSSKESTLPDEFIVVAGTTWCGTTKFSGTLFGFNVGTAWTSVELNLAPEFKECSSSILGESHPTDVRVNGCEYRFSAGSTVEGETKVSGSMGVICPAGKVIETEITASPPCRITVPGQSNVQGVTFHNTGSGASRVVDLYTATSTLAYTQDGSFCPGNNFASSKSFTNGQYRGEQMYTGRATEGAQVGFWVT